MVLAHAHDTGASRVVGRLTELRGPSSVTVVRPEALGLARWKHCVSASGGTHTEILLPGGVPICSADVVVAFNRLQYLPVPRFSRAAPRDRDYAGAELQALVASWLLSLGERVINLVGPRGQSRGPITHRGWLALAVRAGLPVARSARATAGRMLPFPMPRERLTGCAWPGGARGPAPAELVPDGSQSGSVLVVGDDALGPLAERFGPACVALARLAECAVLDVRFVASRDGPVVHIVDAIPPLLEDSKSEAVAELLALHWDRRHPVGGPSEPGRSGVFGR
jgi:hypothetical protein